MSSSFSHKPSASKPNSLNSARKRDIGNRRNSVAPNREISASSAEAPSGALTRGAPAAASPPPLPPPPAIKSANTFWAADASTPSDSVSWIIRSKPGRSPSLASCAARSPKPAACSISAMRARSAPRSAWIAEVTAAGTCKPCVPASWRQKSKSIASSAATARKKHRQRISKSSSLRKRSKVVLKSAEGGGKPASLACVNASATCAQSLAAMASRNNMCACAAVSTCSGSGWLSHKACAKLSSSSSCSHKPCVTAVCSSMTLSRASLAADKCLLA
mmetsp:Transcript_29735/g.86263  ORF Transcript_29735/g.86263 Transcript_29735/m.86263 type:complete len:275 (+) Transcript_29735:173-997(+)